MKIEKIIESYPHLYHMAERDTWESIRVRGLLSATAVLDYFNVVGLDRARFEIEHRPVKMEVLPGISDKILLRDQKPMPPDRLAKGLQDGVTTEEWYKLINEKVFFWTSEVRLHRLLNARDYRKLEHDVLTIDTASFIKDYAKKIWLCHMNSGNTWPLPHRRGKNTFCRIPDYPSKRSGNPVKPVVELVVDYAVPNIEDYVVKVRRMRGDQVLGDIL